MTWPSPLSVRPQEGIWHLRSHPPPFRGCNLDPSKLRSKLLKSWHFFQYYITLVYNLTFFTICQESSSSVTCTMFFFPLLLNPLDDDDDELLEDEDATLKIYRYVFKNQWPMICYLPLRSLFLAPLHIGWRLTLGCSDDGDLEVISSRHWIRHFKRINLRPWLTVVWLNLNRYFRCNYLVVLAQRFGKHVFSALPPRLIQN